MSNFLATDWLLLDAKFFTSKYVKDLETLAYKNPKAHKNTVASHRVNEFSKLSSYVFDDFKIKFLYALEI